MEGAGTCGKTRKTSKREKLTIPEEDNHLELCRSVQETHRLLQKAGKCEPLSFPAAVPANLHIVAHIDVGFGNWLTIRGQGAGLSWNWGTSLRNEGPNRWVWDGVGPIEYKLLLNDVLWERGENRVYDGVVDRTAEAVPHFW
jgi:hypothetical protein